MGGSNRCYCMALFFLLIKGWWKDAVMSLSTYIVGGILGILLMFQCTLICGSLAIMHKANQFEALATEAVEQMVTSGKATLNEIVDQAETQEVMNEIVRNHPPDFVNASPKSMESDCSVKKRLYGEVLLR